MKYIALDLETTGLVAERHQILEIGAIVDDLENPLPIDKLPTYHAYVLQRGDICGDAYALSMHQEILRRIAKRESGYEYVFVDEVLEHFAAWLKVQGIKPNKYGCTSVTLGGKNVASFDLPFLKLLPGYGKIFKAYQRTLDPAMLYLKIDDERLPDLATCLERANMNTYVSHTAVDDSMQVVKLLRAYYNIG